MTNYSIRIPKFTVNNNIGVQCSVNVLQWYTMILQYLYRTLDAFIYH